MVWSWVHTYRIIYIGRSSARRRARRNDYGKLLRRSLGTHKYNKVLCIATGYFSPAMDPYRILFLYLKSYFFMSTLFYFFWSCKTPDLSLQRKGVYTHYEFCPSCCSLWRSVFPDICTGFLLLELCIAYYKLTYATAHEPLSLEKAHHLRTETLTRRWLTSFFFSITITYSTWPFSVGLLAAVLVSP